jgi:hypothetical protein
MIQWIFEIQSILASFIVKHVISIKLITLVHSIALIPAVTTPPEIIPYCRLNHSIWSLSDNKEASRWVLPGSHPVNHLETQRGSNECIKTPTKVSPEYLTHKYQSPCRVHLLRTIIFDMEVKHLEFY